MNLSRKTYETRGDKVVDFVLGFVGWYVLNALIGGATWAIFTGANVVLASSGSDAYQTLEAFLNIAYLICSALPLLVNIGLLLFFALTRYWIAFGGLAAFASSFLVVICLGLLFLGACFALLASYGAMGP